MAESKQINFTIVPADPHDHQRTYANFCAIAHTPFDITLTFCEVLPLTEKDLKEAEADSRGPRPGAREHRAAAPHGPEPDRGAAGARAHVLRAAPDRRVGQAAGPLTKPGRHR